MSDKINFHLYLGKKDYEILVWKNSLPPKCFKYFVEQILLSHINGHTILLPPINYEIAENEVLDGKPIHIVTENQQIIDFLSNIDNGTKSKLVKEILLFYIRESRDMILLSDGKKKKRKQPSQQIIQTQKPSKKSNVLPKEKKQVVENNQQEMISKPIETVEQVKEVIIPPTSDKPKEKSNNKNPMMQALFKMSGDE